ncbi:MAG: biopolymer transporter ExbD [Verrucomicrobia bacterium]|nr:MAG: biopolymer transporter ExbD [Verrucomicrobiota bacterium]
MARTFRRNRQMHALSELNVTNLLDLAFVLLIIFMIATPLINQEQTLPVNLPVESLSPQATSRDTRFVAITVRANGTYLIDSDGNRPLTRADLPARLNALVPAGPNAEQPVIRIRADATVPYQQVITLMEELKKAKLARVSFDTQVRS